MWDYMNRTKQCPETVAECQRRPLAELEDAYLLQPTAEGNDWVDLNTVVPSCYEFK